MAEEVLLLAAACVVITIIISVLMLLQKERAEPDAVEEDNQRPRGVPIVRGQAGEAPPRRAGRNVRARMRAAAVRQEEPELEEEDPLIDEMVLPEGKIGAKKRKKLEMKAEKRLQREREVEEREERKQREKELEEKRQKEEEKAKEEELKKEAEEKALKEEQEQKELEEYLKLKEAFEVEEEGFDEDENAEDTHKFQEFINYIKEQKVVLLEDLASHFKLKTQDVINRIQDLLSQESIIGVIDDRGKFIYITREELESVAQFMRQRGRVSITELAECSNTLINLLPETPVS